MRIERLSVFWSAATCRRFPFQIGVLSPDKCIESQGDDKSSHSKSKKHSLGVSGNTSTKRNLTKGAFTLKFYAFYDFVPSELARWNA